MLTQHEATQFVDAKKRQMADPSAQHGMARQFELASHCELTRQSAHTAIAQQSAIGLMTTNQLARGHGVVPKAMTRAMQPQLMRRAQNAEQPLRFAQQRAIDLSLADREWQAQEYSANAPVPQQATFSSVASNPAVSTLDADRRLLSTRLSESLPTQFVEGYPSHSSSLSLLPTAAAPQPSQHEQRAIATSNVAFRFPQVQSGTDPFDDMPPPSCPPSPPGFSPCVPCSEDEEIVEDEGADEDAEQDGLPSLPIDNWQQGCRPSCALCGADGDVGACERLLFVDRREAIAIVATCSRSNGLRQIGAAAPVPRVDHTGAAIVMKVATLAPQIAIKPVPRPVKWLSGTWVHLNCAHWSSEVGETVSGELLRVSSALQTTDHACSQRSRKTTCVQCGELGATLGCNVHRCRRSYHFKCALESGALLLQDKRLYCCEHRECKQATHHSCVPLSLKPVFRKVTIPLPRRYEKSGLDIPSGQWLRVGGLTVMRLGVTPPSISLPPIGFVACRRLWSTVRAGKTCGYLLRVLADPEAETEAGVEKPMFSLASEDDPEDLIVDPDPQVSPSACATRIARLNGVTARVVDLLYEKLNRTHPAASKIFLHYPHEAGYFFGWLHAPVQRTLHGDTVDSR
ncbi:MAG: hypothetical protein SGPRY_001624, partial [Prymnesium sp.]